MNKEIIKLVNKNPQTLKTCCRGYFLYFLYFLYFSYFLYILYILYNFFYLIYTIFDIFIYNFVSFCLLFSGTCCWQFNFQFSLEDDIYAEDSIELLTKAGIDFKQHSTNGKIKKQKNENFIVYIYYIPIVFQQFVFLILLYFDFFFVRY
jgi:hypothetical protein